MLVGSIPLSLTPPLRDPLGAGFFCVGYGLIPVPLLPIWASQVGLQEVGTERPQSSWGCKDLVSLRPPEPSTSPSVFSFLPPPLSLSSLPHFLLYLLFLPFPPLLLFSTTLLLPPVTSWTEWLRPRETRKSWAPHFSRAGWEGNNERKRRPQQERGCTHDLIFLFQEPEHQPVQLSLFLRCWFLI